MNAHLVFLVSIKTSLCYDSIRERATFYVEDVCSGAFKAWGIKGGKNRGTYMRYVYGGRGRIEVYLWNHVKDGKVDVSDIVDTIAHEYLHHLIGNVTRARLDEDGEHAVIDTVLKCSR
jgi:hypothetical protein